MLSILPTMGKFLIRKHRNEEGDINENAITADVIQTKICWFVESI